MDDKRIQEILDLTKEIKSCLYGKTDNFNDSGLVGQVAKNTNAVSWLTWLYGINLVAFIAVIINSLI